MGACSGAGPSIIVRKLARPLFHLIRQADVYARAKRKYGIGKLILDLAIAARNFQALTQGRSPEKKNLGRLGAVGGMPEMQFMLRSAG